MHRTDLLYYSRLCHYIVVGAWWHPVRVNSPATGVESEGWIWPSEQPRSAKANSWLDYRTGNDNFVYSSLWDLKSSFTSRKILRHWTFPLYFPSERKVCCGFLSPLKIHCFGRVLNPQPVGPVASTLITTPPRRPHRTYITFKLRTSIFYFLWYDFEDHDDGG
jgi:hypothetical protein